MPKNTFVFLLLLTIFAAVVVGVNIARPQEPTTDNRKLTTPQPTPTPTPRPTVYVLSGCGISFVVPVGHTAIDGPTNTVVLTGSTASDTVIVTCQKNIPRPALPADKIERLVFDLSETPGASITATLYHDTQDKLIFRHPKNGLDVFISGSGESFEKLIRSLTILQ